MRVGGRVRVRCSHSPGSNYAPSCSKCYANIYMYIYIYTYIHIPYICIYIYIHIERDCIHQYVYIYIYICMCVYNDGHRFMPPTLNYQGALLRKR